MRSANMKLHQHDNGTEKVQSYTSRLGVALTLEPEFKAGMSLDFPFCVIHRLSC